MASETWVAFCLTHLVLCLIPGPAVLLVLSTSLSRGSRPGMMASCGILAATSLFFALSGTGIAAIFLASNELFTVLKWAGAGYLFYLGVGMLFSKSEPVAATAPSQPSHRHFWRGFLVEGANPKALVFFVAILPAFLDPQAPMGIQILILGVTGIVIEFVVLACYAFAAARARQAGGEGLKTIVERLGGGFLIAAAAKLAAGQSE